MKLVSLNTWSGKYLDNLLKFIQSHSKDTDIFCFQEIYHTTSSVKQYHDIRANLLDEIKQILPEFSVFYTDEFRGFDSCPDPVDFNLTVGEAMFIRNTLKINAQGELPIHGDRNGKLLKKDFSNLPVTLQYINFTINNKFYTVCNFHGTSFPGTKLDTDIRLKQSRTILDFLKSKTGTKIITGDFNLSPQTNSIKMLEGKMNNLIKQFNIEKTRSSLSPYSKRGDFQKFADYIFVSDDINVLNFQVPYIEISDHLPMILEFS